MFQSKQLIDKGLTKGEKEAEAIKIQLKRKPRIKWGPFHFYRSPLWLEWDPFGHCRAMRKKGEKFHVSWDYWRKKIRKACPIQYWFREELTFWLSYWFGTYRREKWYEFKCNFHPYNVLRIKTLPKTWTDENTLMTHAMFAVLERFMNEKPDTIIDVVHNVHQRKFWKEISKAWAWWQKREEREKMMDEAYEIAKTRPRHYKYRAMYREVIKLERQFDREEKEMLQLLIKWKDCLWV